MLLSVPLSVPKRRLLVSQTLSVAKSLLALCHTLMVANMSMTSLSKPMSSTPASTTTLTLSTSQKAREVSGFAF